MTLSICIPSFNKGNVIKYTIESILKQDFEDYELLVVDDCSTDNSMAILESYAATNPKIRIVRNEQNIGLVKNWNKCLKLAQGDFIYIVHADDILVPGILNRYVSYLLQNPDCNFLHSNVFDVTLPSSKRRIRVTQNQRVLPKGNSAVIKILMNNNLACSSVVVSRQCYQLLGDFDEDNSLSPDWEMWARIAKEFDLHHLDTVGSYFICDYNNTHLSRIDPKLFADEQIKYYEKILSYMKDFDEKTLRMDCINQLNLTLTHLAVKYFSKGNFYTSLAYYKTRTRISVSTFINFLIQGSYYFIKNNIRTVLNKKPTFSQLYSKYLD